MNTPQGSKSDVARLLQRFDLEYQAAQLGLSGLAQGTAQHGFITARLENMENARQELEKLVGTEEATELVVERMSKQEGKDQGSDQQAMEEDLLTVQEVAKRLRVHDTTVRRWIASGYLDAIPLPKGIGKKQSYRIKRSTLNELLRQARQ